MAIKREKKLVDYQTKIGVTRGAGMSTAANNAAREAQIFDQILNEQADANLKRLQERGKTLGKERANKTVFDSVSSEIEVDGVMKLINVPVQAPTPTGMGLTEAKVYQENIVNVYNNRMRTDLDTQIIESSKEAVMNNASPDMFDKDVDARLTPFFEAMADGSHKEEMKSYAQNRKDVHGFKVFENNRRNMVTTATFNFETDFENANVFANNRYKDRKIGKEEFYSFINIDDLKEAGVNTTVQEQKIKASYEAYNLAHDFWKQYPYAKNPNDVHKLNRLMTNKVDEITLKDGQVVKREDLLKYRDNMLTGKILENDLKNMDIYNDESYNNSISRQRYEKDFSTAIDSLIKGNPYTSSITSSTDDFAKHYYKNRPLYDQKLETTLKANGINPTPLNKFDSMLKAHNFADEVIVNKINSALMQPTTESLAGIMPYIDSINEHRTVNPEFKIKGFTAKESRQLGMLSALYERNEGNILSTVNEYNQIKDNVDTSGKITNILQKNLTSSSYVNKQAELRQKVQLVIQNSEIAFSYDNQFMQEVLRDVELSLILGATVEKDDEYEPLIKESMNNVLAYDGKYSVDYTTSPQLPVDEVLFNSGTYKTDQRMQRTKVVKYGALRTYGVVDSQHDSKKESELSINYMQDKILDELSNMDSGYFSNGEAGKKAFIKRLSALKGTNEFYYQDKREEMHIQLIPISSNYIQGQKPEYYLGLYDVENGKYVPIEEAGFPGYLTITEEEFEEQKDKYIETIRENR